MSVGTNGYLAKDQKKIIIKQKTQSVPHFKLISLIFYLTLLRYSYNR